MGEFFGVKSALGSYMREETAIVLQDSAVMVFSVPEFEQLASKNTRIITKMLKVFSNQLRRIHRQVQNLMVSDEQVNPETGLYKIGEYYLKNKRYGQALYAYKRYLVYYPSGAYATDVDEQDRPGGGVPLPVRLGRAGSAAASAGPRPGRRGPHPPAPAASPRAGGGRRPAENSDLAQQYYNAVSLVSQEKYLEAFKAFKKILEGGAGSRVRRQGRVRDGQVPLLPQAVRQLHQVLHRDRPEVPQAPRDEGRAVLRRHAPTRRRATRRRRAAFYKKIISMGTEDDPVVRKVKKALRALEGEKA